jgi:phage terminase small subunit
MSENQENFDEFEDDLESPPDPAELRKLLTAKEKTFADFYLGEAQMNATRAAKLAGYTGNQSTMTSAGYKIIRRPHVKAYIDAVMDEVAMSARENLARLASIARGSIDDVLADDDEGKNPNIIIFDLAKARANGSIHLVKKIKTKRMVREKKTEIVDLPESVPSDVQDILDELGAAGMMSTEILTEEVEFELYSATEALELLGKHHKLFTQKIDATIDDGADVIFYIPENGRDA